MTQWILPLGIMTVLVLANAVLSFYALFRARVSFKAATELHEETCRLSDAKVAALQSKLDALAAEIASSAEQAATAPAASVKPAMNLNKRSHALRLHRRGDPPEAIAAHLGLPVQEVDLLIKVHRIVLSSL
jgi:hypothetical protein